MSRAATSSPAGRGANPPSLDRSILRLALPAIINNITVPLLGLSDTAISGHLGSAAFIGAVAVGSMMLNVFFWLFGFLRMGTSGLTAVAYGAGNRGECRRALNMALLLAAGISLAILLFQAPLLRGLAIVTGATGEVGEYAELYFRICVWGVPAQLATMAISGWFVGMQTTAVPAGVAIATNVINIILSVTLVFGVGMGFAGIPVGTLAANWIGMAGVLICVRKKVGIKKFFDSPAQTTAADSSAVEESGEGRVESSERRERREEGELGGRLTLRKFFSVNGDLFLRSACVMGVSLAMTSIGARLGDLTLAANAVVMQFFIFFSYFMDGFAFAGEALVGKAAGEGEARGVRAVVRRLLRWAMWMAGLFFLLYLAGEGLAVDLLTDDAAVRERVSGMRVFILLLPPITVLAFIFDGIFIGLTRTRSMLVATLLATAIFVAVIWAGGGGKLPSNTLLWAGFISYLFLRGAILGGIYTWLEKKSLSLSEVPRIAGNGADNAPPAGAGEEKSR